MTEETREDIQQPEGRRGVVGWMRHWWSFVIFWIAPVWIIPALGLMYFSGVPDGVWWLPHIFVLLYFLWFVGLVTHEARYGPRRGFK